MEGIRTVLPGERWSRFALRKVHKHVVWLRDEGISRLVEEDELNPVDRAGQAWRKARWRFEHRAGRAARLPVFVVGLQRSGTNMLVRGLGRSPEVEVRNENDRGAFRRYRLRSDETIDRLVRGSGHAMILFKPLCDSHEVTRMLDRWGGRAVWVFRDVDGRVQSTVRKFGDDDRHTLLRIVEGTGDHLWQAQAITDQTRAVIAGLSPADLSPESAAALFWWVRNGLFFELGLDQRPDLLLASYDSFVRDPEPNMRMMCDFLGTPYRAALVEDFDERALRTPRLDIDPRVRALCDELYARLTSCADAQRRRLLAPAHPAAWSGNDRPAAPPHGG